MSRTPSMTSGELEALLGPRGSLTVTDSNRPTIRKWLVANGIPSLFACKMRHHHLAGAYNDPSLLAHFKAQAVSDNSEPSLPPNAPGESPDNRDTRAPLPHFPMTPAPAATTPAATTPGAIVTPAPTPDAATAQALQTLLTLLGNRNAGLDADAVRVIVRDELPNLIPTTRLELVTADGVKDCGTEPRHRLVSTLIQIMSQKIPAALVGPAGSGKTTATEQAARALGIPYYIQGAVQGAHELLGFVDAHGRYQSTPFRQAFEHGGIICLDELDAGDAAGILVCNSALANGCMAFPDTTTPVARHADFIVIACLNTFGTGADRLYVGRQQLDAATLDRFAFLAWNYDERLERAIVGADAGRSAPHRTPPACTMDSTQWCERVQALRAGVVKEKARVVISPRATIYGVKLIAAGMAQETIEECLIWKGIDAELRKRIEASAI